MKAKIIQNFIGIINEKEIRKEQTFYTSEFVIENIEMKFKVTLPKIITDELIEVIHEILLEDYEIGEVEEMLMHEIHRAPALDELHFGVFQHDVHIGKLNQLLKEIVL